MARLFSYLKWKLIFFFLNKLLLNRFLINFFLILKSQASETIIVKIRTSNICYVPQCQPRRQQWTDGNPPSPPSQYGSTPTCFFGSFGKCACSAHQEGQKNKNVYFELAQKLPPSFEVHRIQKDQHFWHRYGCLQKRLETRNAAPDSGNPLYFMLSTIGLIILLGKVNYQNIKNILVRVLTLKGESSLNLTNFKAEFYWKINYPILSEVMLEG